MLILKPNYSSQNRQLSNYLPHLEQVHFFLPITIFRSSDVTNKKHTLPTRLTTNNKSSEKCHQKHTTNANEILSSRHALNSRTSHDKDKKSLQKISYNYAETLAVRSQKKHFDTDGSLA